MIAPLVALVLAQTYYSPVEAQSLFSQANDAYYREDYATAKDDYRKLVDHGFGSPDVLYNLGTAALAQGELGEAVLYLERARQMGKAPDVDANLTLARSRQMDQVVGGQTEEPFLQRLAAATPDDALVLVFLAAWIAGVLGLLFVRRVPRLRASAWAWVFAGLIAIAVPTGLLLANVAYVHRTVREAVVMRKTAAAREFPKDVAKVSFEVHAGLKVRLLEQQGDFVRIRLPNGLEGWTERDGVAPI